MNKKFYFYFGKEIILKITKVFITSVHVEGRCAKKIVGALGRQTVLIITFVTLYIALCRSVALKVGWDH